MNKTAIVTGATTGIGRAIVLQFAANGFDIAFCARNEMEVNKFCAELADLYPNQTFLGIKTDMSNTEQVHSFCQEVLKKCKNIAVLVNNAGLFMPGSMLEEANGSLETMINTNLYSAYYTTKNLVPAMISAKDGYIFNICSIASIQAYKYGGSYSISKFAMLGFSKSLREELKDKNIRVTALLPGATLTDSWAGVDLPPERFMPASDIAKAVWELYNLSHATVVEELILRPQLGDI